MWWCVSTELYKDTFALASGLERRKEVHTRLWNGEARDLAATHDHAAVPWKTARAARPTDALSQGEAAARWAARARCSVLASLLSQAFSLQTKLTLASCFPFSLVLLSAPSSSPNRMYPRPRVLLLPPLVSALLPPLSLSLSPSLWFLAIVISGLAVHGAFGRLFAFRFRSLADPTAFHQPVDTVTVCSCAGCSGCSSALEVSAACGLELLE